MAVTLQYDYANSFFYNLHIVPTNFNDAINSLTSDLSERIGYKFNSDFYVENDFIGTLRTVPFNNIGSVQLNSFTSNVLSYDKNWLFAPSTSNPNSFKKCNVNYGEEFSRRLRFNSISSYTTSTSCTSSTILKLNFDNPTMLISGDRVYITKDLSDINRQYNTYGKVYSSGYTSSTVLIDYSYTPYVESGYVWEGCEFFDFAVVNGIDPTITTTNPHGLGIGDQIILQMDNVSRSSLTMTASAGQHVSLIRSYDPTLGTYSAIMTQTITFSTTFEAFLGEITDQINCQESLTSGYSAYYYGGDTIYLTSPYNSGSFYNGWKAELFGFAGTVVASTFSSNAGYDINGKGFNPGLSSTYTIVGTPSTTTFVIDKFPDIYYNTDPGSERGTIYSMNSFKLKNQIIGTTFSLLNASYNLFDTIKSNSNIKQFANAQNEVELSLLTTSTFSNIEVTFNSFTSPFTIDMFNRNSITGTGPAVSYYLLDTYDSSGSLLNSFTVSNVGNIDEKVSYGVGPYNLNVAYYINSSNFNPTLGAGNWPISSLVERYEIRVMSSTGIQMSNKWIFNKRCDKEPMALVYLNCYGAWEYFPFDGWTMKRKDQLSRSSFLKVGNYLDGYTQITTDDTTRGNTTYDINASSKYTIYTPYVKKDSRYMTQIASVYNSNEVYLMKFDDVTINSSYIPAVADINILPIELLDNEPVIANSTNKLVYYEINFKLASYKNYKTIGN